MFNRSSDRELPGAERCTVCRALDDSLGHLLDDHASGGVAGGALYQGARQSHHLRLSTRSRRASQRRASRRSSGKYKGWPAPRRQQGGDTVAIVIGDLEPVP